MSVINITILKQFVENKSIDQVKLDCEDLDISVREFNYIKEVDLSQLYLLYSDKNKTPLQHQCNGVILEKNTNKVICSSHNKFHVLDKNQEEETQNLNRLNEELNQYKIELEYCEDGTVIRLYNYKGMWLTSTTKCIDARHSYWSNEKSFGNMFWELFDFNYLPYLDHTCTYFFILKHVDNRIVIKHPKSHLMYIHSVNNETQEIFNDSSLLCYNEPDRHLQNMEVIDNEESFPLQREEQREEQSESSDNEQYDVYPKPSFDKLHLNMQYIEKIDVTIPDKISFEQLEQLYNPTKRGIIVKMMKDNLLHYYQYDFEYFRQIVSVRGNVPLVRMRYLELLNDDEKLALLEHTYPEHMMVFTLIRHSLENVYKQIHKLYIDSHVKHNITVDSEHKYYQTLRQLHGEYKTKGHPITLDKVKEKVNSLEPYVIKKFIGWV